MISGKVVDASALAALVRGRLSAVAWFATAKTTGLTLYLSALALAEVRAVRPDAGSELAEALSHPSVVLGELDAVAAREVDQLLLAADGCGGHVVHVARNRDWPVLSADPGRLRHIDPAVQVDLL
ncbi:MAG: hypothetical protein ACRDQ4_02940 [Pseudonocardiaceae bacterium]